MKTKICTKCEQEYPATVEFFRKESRSPAGLHSWCRKCKDTYEKAWRIANPDKCRKNVTAWQKANPEKFKSAQRRGDLRRSYGITVEQYDQVFEIQGGVCAICGGVNLDGRRLFVDHNHETGKIRGLLCLPCNYALGYLKESPELFIKALHYLIRNKREDYPAIES